MEKRKEPTEKNRGKCSSDSGILKNKVFADIISFIKTNIAVLFMNILAKQMKKSYLHLSLEFSAFYLKDKTILKEMSYNTSLVAMGFAEDEVNEVDKEFEDLNEFEEEESSP